MKSFKVLFMLLLILGLAASVGAQNMNVKATDVYTISVPNDWQVMAMGDSIYTASYAGESLTPVTVLVVVEKVKPEDKDKSMEEIADAAIQEGSADLVAAGMEDAIDIVETGEVKFNGYDAYHYAMNVSVMGMNFFTDSYLFNKNDNIISLSIVGDQTDLDTMATQIAAIKKSFKLK